MFKKLANLLRNKDPQARASEDVWWIALLMSAVGGFLDAFTWVGHGGVFANAQTGNVVLFGVSAAVGHWHQAFEHLPPLAAFFVGVWVATWLRVRSSRLRLRHVALVSLVIEIIVLAVIAFLPGDFPDIPVVLAISFIAAVQTSSFRRVRQWAYSSIMTTGNLRQAAESLFHALRPPRDPVILEQAKIFACLCLTFGMGAFLGGWLTARWGNPVLALPILALALTLYACLAQRPQAPDAH
ncbi:YoaK family protein [Pseudomonas abieticivorans]|uniref:YoaK family protein n=1 Tax=Pseudomonas abieticivorans TaxID=2931382 RepID=UPI0020C0CC44|nr:YoaK family protein [Pseudomonas sp. PIA16]